LREDGEDYSVEINVPLLQGLSLKIGDSADDRKTYPTGRLLKGFLLLDQGQELAEEAVGFGAPVLKKGLKTIFPGAVSLTWLRRGAIWDITAVFKLNLIERFSRGGNNNVENRMFYTVKNFLEAVIRGLPLLRGFLTATSSMLRRMFNWETTYADAGFSIDVKVNYTIEAEAGKVTVEIDTRGLPPDITEVVVMNEQGAHYFDQYRDTSGVSLQREEIGCWDEVNAEEAWFESRARHVAFRLKQANDARLFRGRELVGSRLAWAGFGYSFPPSIKDLHYEMRIERLA
jgi:hypothetical protein